MEEFIPFMMIVGGAVVLFFALVRNARVRRINEMWQRVGDRYGADLQKASLFHGPELRFRYKGSEVRFRTERLPRRADVGTVLSISWPDPELECEITVQPFYGALVRMLGPQSIAVGALRFDREYMVRGSNADAIRAMLSAGVQNQIDQLRAVGGKSDLEITIDDGTLEIRRRKRRWEFATLAQFLRAGLELFDQAMLTNMSGIEIMGESMAVIAGESMCQVCGETIGQDVVYCRGCKTPHHYECWQYIGNCSTYGCGERRYLAGRKAARALERE